VRSLSFRFVSTRQDGCPTKYLLPFYTQRGPPVPASTSQKFAWVKVTMSTANVAKHAPTSRGGSWRDIDPGNPACWQSTFLHTPHFDIAAICLYQLIEGPIRVPLVEVLVLTEPAGFRPPLRFICRSLCTKWPHESMIYHQHILRLD
jgi:hypothetical protein